MAMEVAKQLGVTSITQEGVYAMVGGPNFESVSEARLLHQLGVDAVGKNTENNDLPLDSGRNDHVYPVGLSSEVQILRLNLFFKQQQQTTMSKSSYTILYVHNVIYIYINRDGLQNSQHF